MRYSATVSENWICRFSYKISRRKFFLTATDRCNANIRSLASLLILILLVLVLLILLILVLLVLLLILILLPVLVLIVLVVHEVSPRFRDYY